MKRRKSGQKANPKTLAEKRFTGRPCQQLPIDGRYPAHQFHKAELLMVIERRKTVEEAEALIQLTNVLNLEVDVISKKFSERLQKEVQDDALGLDVKNIRIESENAIS